MAGQWASLASQMGRLLRSLSTLRSAATEKKVRVAPLRQRSTGTPNHLCK